MSDPRIAELRASSGVTAVIVAALRAYAAGAAQAPALGAQADQDGTPARLMPVGHEDVEGLRAFVYRAGRTDGSSRPVGLASMARCST